MSENHSPLSPPPPKMIKSPPMTDLASYIGVLICAIFQNRQRRHGALLVQGPSIFLLMSYGLLCDCFRFFFFVGKNRYFLYNS